MKFVLAAALTILAANLPAQNPFINEILASNAATNPDPQFNEFSDWVEIFNPGPNAVNLTGWHLTDDADEAQKWPFPPNTNLLPGNFLLVWADGQNTGLHANFKLGADGEFIGLTKPDGSFADQFKFAEQKTDVSFGRKTDGGTEMVFFTKPTPGTSNNGGQSFTDFVVAVPVFNLPGGFYDDPVMVEIQNLTGSGTVRYTLDGSEPTENSPAFSQPFEVFLSQVVKAKIFRGGQIAGPTVTNTYFIGEDLQTRGVAVLSLSSDPKNFYDPATGLFVQTFKPDWEYPVHLEFYEPDGLLGFHHDAGMSLGGTNAWQLPQKMLNIFSRKKYGGGNIEYQIFPDNPRTEFEDIILRTSGSDWGNTLFRDGMMQRTAQSTADLDGQSFRPVAAFVNGQYYGIYNIREKQDADYIKHYHGIAPENLDYIENDGEVKVGDDIEFRKMTDLLTSGVSIAAKFQELEQLADIQSFTDYTIAQLFCANSSWGHNIALFRERSPAGRWRWLMHDFDRGFVDQGGTALNFFTTPNGTAGLNPPEATLFLRKMLENADYKQRFIKRLADHLFITWNPLNVVPKINLHEGWIKNEIPYHIGKWTGTTSSYGNGIPDLPFWQNEVKKLRDFSTNRNLALWQNMTSFFTLNDGFAGLILEAGPNASAGKIKLHDLDVPSLPWSGNYLKNKQLQLTATPRPGFNFLRWEKREGQNLTFIWPGSNWKYSDATTAPPSGWNKPNFDDSTWKSGAAQLGYGDGDEATVLNFGPDPNFKTPTYYFRTRFQVTNPAALETFFAKMKIDDGAIVYLNGTEVWRFNLVENQDIMHEDYAIDFVGGTDENLWREMNLPVSALVSGENILAVEVHQSDPNSSDISFDFELGGFATSPAQNLGNQPVLDVAISGTTVIRAVFGPDGTCGVLPDTISQNMTLTAACSPYRAFGDVVLKAGATLTVQAGVEIQMPQNSDFWIHGLLKINGLQNNPVKIKNAPGSQNWGGLLFENTSLPADIKFLEMENATSGEHRIYFPAAISARNADLNLDNVDMTKVLGFPIFSRNSDVVLTNSKVKILVTGDGINVKNGKARIENCSFSGGYAVDCDGIDLDGVTDGIVRNCEIHDFRGDNNDGLDIGEQCQNLQIEGNFIYHCWDKGISVGQQSTATIRNNTIAYTNYGVALKDRCQVLLDHNTFFGTQNGIAAYEKNPGEAGGNGTVTNSVVSNSAISAFSADAFSSLSMTNCLSDTDTLTALSNQTNDPKFVNPSKYNFNLKPGSPAIGAGTGGSNLGANPLPNYFGQPQIMLSEIFYFDLDSSEGEFVEIYNYGTQSIDLQGFKLGEGIDFEFPAGAAITAGEYIVVAKNASKFPGANFQVFEWAAGKLKNEGETIHLFDRDGLLVDFVKYNNHAPWPEELLVVGKSLELVAPDLDNHHPTSWQISASPGGSPGFPSGTVSAASPVSFLQLTVFPNPVSGGAVSVFAKGEISTELFLEVVDNQGVRRVFQEFPGEGVLRQMSLDLSAFSAGAYFLVLKNAAGKVLASEKIAVF